MAQQPVKISGATALGVSRPVLILERTDASFLPALLAELAVDGGLATVENTQQAAVTENNVLKLFQPVQRTFHLALYEGYCDQIVTQRVDSARIESAVLVVRRLAQDAQGNTLPNQYEGWFEADKHLRGWLPLNGTTADQDPDPARRPVRSLGHPELDRLLALQTGVTEQLAERTSPLFVAPPDVCAAAKKTLIFGLIPVTSTEVNTVGIQLPAYSSTDIAGQIPPYLLAGQPGVTLGIPYPGSTITAQTLQDANTGVTPKDPNADNFVTFLQQMAIEFNAFSASDNPLLQQLNQVTLQIDANTQTGLGDWLNTASQVMVYGNKTDQTEPTSVTMPQSWPQLTDAQAQAIAGAIGGAMRAQLTTLNAGEGRYEDPQRQYVLRAFVRVRRDDGCPPDLVHSCLSAPFSIAAWYENNTAVPGVKINLPDVTDKSLLKKLKPNVGFVLPPPLFNFLQQNSPTDTLKGNLSGDGSGGIGLGWLCSFSLPLITICAFLVLNIFLSLFNIVFFWMAFIKICIPIPFPKK